MHHRCQLLLKGAWEFLLKQPSKSPVDAICNRFDTFWGTYSGPKTFTKEDVKPLSNAESSPLIRRLQSDLRSFYNSVTGGEKEKFAPRKDYGQLWDLIMVSL